MVRLHKHLSKDFMKKLVSRIMAVVVLFSIIGLVPTQKASAGVAPPLTSFYIDTYVDQGNGDYAYCHELSENPTFHKSAFPMLVESYQMGYGRVTVYLDGVALQFPECRDYKINAIKKDGSNEVIGWDNVYSITPNSSRLYNGTHTIEEVCIGTTTGRVMKSSFKFTIAD